MANVFEKLVAVLDLDTSMFEKNSDKAKEKGTALEKGLSKIGGAVGVAALGGVVAGVGAISGAMVEGIAKTSDWAGKMDSIQDILGGTNEQASGAALMFERIGGNAEQLTGSIKKMAMGLEDGKGGLGKTGQALKDMGINLYDANGKMKDAYTIFGEVGDVASKMPDGLEKDAMLMGVFGKSGAELGDALNAAANGGVKSFQDEATKLGLAIDPAPVIEMQKAQAQLDATFNGLWVTLGSALVPVLMLLINKFQTWLSDPVIMEGIKTFTSNLVNFAMQVISYIPIVVGWFTTIFDFLKNNQGIIVGVLAGLGVALGFFVWTVAIPALIAFATTTWAAFGPAILIIAGIALAVGLLATAWDNDWGGIRTTLTMVWEQYLKPAFSALSDWLSVALPKVAKYFSDVWNEKMTIIKTVGTWINDHVTPAFNWLGRAIQDVTSFFSNLGSAMGSLTNALPSWLTPHSPFKLTTAFWGLNDALKEISKNTLPDFGGELTLSTKQADVSGLMTGVSSNSLSSQPDLSELIKAVKDSKIDKYELAKIFKDSVAILAS